MIRFLRDLFGRPQGLKAHADYERKVWSTVDYLLCFVTGRPGDVFSAEWILNTYPGFRRFVAESAASEHSASETALLIAHRVLATSLEHLPSEELAAIREDLTHQNAAEAMNPITSALTWFSRNSEVVSAKGTVSDALVDITLKDLAAILDGETDSHARALRRLATWIDQRSGLTTL